MTHQMDAGTSRGYASEHTYWFGGGAGEGEREREYTNNNPPKKEREKRHTTHSDRERNVSIKRAIWVSDTQKKFIIMFVHNKNY
jgi:hypothetical protein